MKIYTHMYSGKQPESIKNGVTFDVMQLRREIEISWNDPISCDPLLPSMATFQKWGVSQRSEGSSKIFPGRQVPRLQLLLTSLLPNFSPSPQCKNRFDWPVKET